MESVSVENTIDQPEQPITCLGYTLDMIKMSRLSDKQKHKDGFCFLATSHEFDPSFQSVQILVDAVVVASRASVGSASGRMNG